MTKEEIIGIMEAYFELKQKESQRRWDWWEEQRFKSRKICLWIIGTIAALYFIIPFLMITFATR